MKFIFFFLLLLTTTSVFAQEADSTAQPETFELEWAGETQIMQKYFIVFLKSGPERIIRAEEASILQKKHLDYLGNLYQKGIIVLNGPTDGEGEIRGFSVYAVATKEEAIKLASEDPMVKGKHLEIEVHPWWLAKGSRVE